MISALSGMKKNGRKKVGLGMSPFAKRLIRLEGMVRKMMRKT
jgi:hypothetical protein